MKKESILKSSLTSHIISIRFVIAIMLIMATQISYAQIHTAAPGNYDDPNTWNGSVPIAGSDVVIDHDVYFQKSIIIKEVNSITVSSSGTLSIKGSAADTLIVNSLINLNGGVLNVNSGNVRLGPNGGSNKELNMLSGALTLTGGTVNVNGRVMLVGGTFTMSGTTSYLTIDPNGGTPANSVAPNLDILTVYSGVTGGITGATPAPTVTGGTIRIVDPPYQGTGKSFCYRGSSGSSSWIGNTMILGSVIVSNGTRTLGPYDVSYNPLGFNIDTKIDDSYVELGNVNAWSGGWTRKISPSFPGYITSVEFGGMSTYRFISGSDTASNGFDIGGTLTIEDSSIVRTFKVGSKLRIRGDLNNNNGGYLDEAGISFSNRLGSNTKPQRITRSGNLSSGYPAAIYTHSMARDPKLFGAATTFSFLEIDNIATPEAVTMDIMDGEKTFLIDSINLINGLFDYGSRKTMNFIFETGAKVKRLNGGIWAYSTTYKYGCTYYRFSGPSSFTFPIADKDSANPNKLIYSPVTLNFSENKDNNKLIGVSVYSKTKDFVSGNVPVNMNLYRNMNNPDTSRNYIKRYWQILLTDPGAFKCSATFQFDQSDIVGDIKKIKTNLWTGTAWSQAYSYANATTNTLFIPELTQVTFPNANIALVSGREHSVTKYYWVGKSGANWKDGSSWDPQRPEASRSSTDILVFDRDVKPSIPSTIVATNVSSQQVSQLLLNKVDLTLQPEPKATSFQLVGGFGSALDIPANSSLTIKDSAGKYPLYFGYLGAQEANISGSLTIAPINSSALFNTYDGKNATTIISGTLNNAGIILSGLVDSTKTFDSLVISGNYNHAFATVADAGQQPQFVTRPTTKYGITGFTTYNGNIPAYLTKLPNLTYNTSNQISTVNFSNGTSIDSLTILSTQATGKLQLNGTVYVNKLLDVRSKSQVSLNGILKIPGQITTDGGGPLEALNGTVEMMGQAPQTIPANLFYNNAVGTLAVNNPTSVSLAGTTGVDTVLNLMQGQLITNDNLVLRSQSIRRTARVLPINYPNPIVGNVTVERFIPAGRRAYRFISPSVTTTSTIRDSWMEGVNNTARGLANNKNPVPGYGTHITGKGSSIDFDVTATNNPSLFYYDNDNLIWKDATTTSSTLKAGSPWRLFVRGDRGIDLTSNTAVPTQTVLRSKGILLTGDFTLGNSTTPKINSTINSFSFIGNPYPSPVDWGKIYSTSRDIAPTYTAWDPNLNTQGGYISYNALNGQTSTTATGVSVLDKNLQSGQAFFVQATGPNPLVIFKEAYKSSGANTKVFRTASDMTKLTVALLFKNSQGSEVTADGFVAVFDESFKNTIGIEDSYKYRNLDENLAINNNGTLLSIDGRAPVNKSDTIQLNMSQYRQKDYTLQLNGINFSPSIAAFLQDAYLKKESPIDLSGATSIPFSINSDSGSYAANRFIIVFKTKAAPPITVTNIKAYPKEKGIQLEWNTIAETDIVRYDIEKSTTIQSLASITTIQAEGIGKDRSYSWYDARPNKGDNFYRIKIFEKSGTVRYTTVARVNIVDKKVGISIYPNPVVNNTLAFQISNMKRGVYTVNIYGNSGQLLYTSQVVYNGSSASYSINIGGAISKGTYRVKISNNEVIKTETIELK